MLISVTAQPRRVDLIPIPTPWCHGCMEVVQNALGLGHELTEVCFIRCVAASLAAAAAEARSPICVAGGDEEARIRTDSSESFTGDPRFPLESALRWGAMCLAAVLFDPLSAVIVLIDSRFPQP